MRQLLSLFLLVIVTISLGCNGDSTVSNTSNTSSVNGPSGKASPASAPQEQIPVYSYEVVNTFPHDSEAFTQGLIFHDGALIESTGLERHSTLRRVELQTGKVLQKVDVSPFYFAEGMTLFDGKIYQITWKGQKGFIYDPKSFQKTGEFEYDGEGWGLTHDADSLILSNGSNELRFLDPSDTRKIKRTLRIFDQGKPLAEINELEYVKGEIYANVWHQDRIARIDPLDGKIKGWIDMSGLLKPSEVTDPEAVLNGIAYDETGDRLFVTGKLWPKLFEIKLKLK
jgi:glutaminyl-peptide cyclotransferase